MTFCNEGNHTEKWAAGARGRGQKAGGSYTTIVTCQNSKTVHCKGGVYGHTSAFLKVCLKKKIKKERKHWVGQKVHLGLGKNPKPGFKTVCTYMWVSSL